MPLTISAFIHRLRPGIAALPDEEAIRTVSDWIGAIVFIFLGDFGETKMAVADGDLDHGAGIIL
jgi:hypothetical protein